MLMLFTLVSAYAQKGSKDWTLLMVTQVEVVPSMVVDYEASLADMKNLLEEKKVSDYYHFTHILDNYSFMHITPIESLTDIEKGTKEYLRAKLDDPLYDLIRADIDEISISQKTYILKYGHSLSHVPENDSWDEGQQYRKLNYYQVFPGYEDEFEDNLAAWSNLYKNKNIKSGFRVFKSFIGLETPLYMLATWASSPMEHQRDLQDAMTLLGEEGTALWSNMMQYVQRVEVSEGWYLPQYSYANGTRLAAGSK
jgi:hypothetical protein